MNRFGLGACNPKTMVTPE